MLLIGESNEAMCRPSVETSGFNQVLIKQSNRGVTVIIKSFNARTLLVVANSSHARVTDRKRRPDLCSSPWLHPSLAIGRAPLGLTVAGRDGSVASCRRGCGAALPDAFLTVDPAPPLAPIQLLT
jgi:hypothetical protein